MFQDDKSIQRKGAKGAKNAKVLGNKILSGLCERKLEVKGDKRIQRKDAKNAKAAKVLGVITCLSLRSLRTLRLCV